MSEFWIQTFTGKRFDLLEPTIDMICIEDIAHHLSIENRFAGATKFAYSVGYHSVLASNQAPKHLKLEALLHDAEEAYYKDLPYHWKILIRREIHPVFWEQSVNQTKRLIDIKYGLTFSDESHKIIKNIDLRMSTTEKNQLLKDPPIKWNDTEPYNIEIMKLQPENVEELFLKEYEKYRRI